MARAGWARRAGARAGGWQQADLPPTTDVTAWLSGRLPDGWFVGAPEVTVDREEIVIVGELPAVGGRVRRHRGGARRPCGGGRGADLPLPGVHPDERIEIARQAEHRYQRKVAWGARLGEHVELFTVASVPVMTRLRQPERVVLDTLVDSGVARSRSDALAWAVRLVGQHADEWLGELRAAMAKVDDLRAKGPTGEGPDPPVEGQPGNSASQIATWWQIAASTVAAWKNSWKPNVFGQGSGRRSRT